MLVHKVIHRSESGVHFAGKRAQSQACLNYAEREQNLRSAFASK